MSKEEYKYFEVSQPYFALIKARDVEELKELYEKNIAENIELDSIEEVTEAYANFRTGMAIALELIRLDVSHNDIMNSAVKEAYEFVKKENILLVDGGLM